MTVTWRWELTPTRSRAAMAAPALASIKMAWFKLFVALKLRALVNPSLALALLRVAWRFRRRGWWSRFPFLPVPSERYLRWRMYTAYADEEAVPSVQDVIAYARWSAQQP